MKLEMTKKHLVDALARMNEIATKGVKSEFEDAGRVTIDAQDDKVVFLSTNGHIFATFEVTKETDAAIKVEETGQVTISSPILLATCRALGGRADDHVFELVATDNLTVKDLDRERVDKRRQSLVELQILDENHKFQISKPRSGFTYRFPTDVFTKAANTVSKYRPGAAYRIEYEMICLHFLKDEIRFVCGNGSRFGVYCIPLDKAGSDATGMPSIPEIDDEDGKKFVLPVDQASIVMKLLSGSEHVTFTYRDSTHLYIKPENGAVLEVKGIPLVEYIAYEKHAFRTHQAKAIVDIHTLDLEEGASVIWAVRDKEMEDEENYHTYSLDLEEGREAFFAVTDKKYNAKWKGPAEYYNISAASFKSDYSARALQEVFDASAGKGFVRFYCVDEKTVMIAEPVDLNENKKDDNGVPEIIREGTDHRFFFFYASAQEPDEK